MTIINRIVSILLIGFAVSIHAQQPVPTAITYQGSLEEAGQPANGSYDLQFQLYDGSDSGSGSVVGSAVVSEDVAVTDGVFSVQLDFGAAAFDSEARWLEIGVRDGASTGGFTLLTPFSPVTPAPQARFAVKAANADLAANASQLDGMSSGDFALAGHAHAVLSAGDGLTGANYDGTGATTFGVGAGDGITVSADEVAARVDGSSIDFNTSGELSMLPHGPGYGEVATVAKSGGDYTDPVAAMNDLSSWCSQTVTCVLRVMPGLYDLTAPLELEPLVHIVGTGPFTALRRNDTGITSGVVDASNCINSCQMTNLYIGTQSTGSGSQSVGVYSQGGRVELKNVFFSISSTTDAAFGIYTDSDTWIIDSEFHHFGDDGSPVRATNGRITIEESEINANGGGIEAIAVHSTGAALLLARNEIEASNADTVIAVSISDSFIEDQHSRLDASDSSISTARAILASNCNTSGVKLVGTDLRAFGATDTRAIFADNCWQVDASGIDIVAGPSGHGITLRETPLVLNGSRLESGDHAISLFYSASDTNSYPVRVLHSRLKAPNDLMYEAGPYDDTAVALSQLEDGTVSGAVTCTNNVDENLADLGNTCP